MLQICFQKLLTIRKSLNIIKMNYEKQLFKKRNELIIKFYAKFEGTEK